MHEGHRKRLKERFLKEGLAHFQPHEVLELLLFYALPRKDTNALSHRLLETFGSLQNVLEADISQLKKIEGMGEHGAILLGLMPQISSYYTQQQNEEAVFLSGSAQGEAYVKSLFRGKKYEAFYLIHLNTRNKVNFAQCLQTGTIDQAAVYPRLVVESALRHRSSKIILAHNHPGGSLTPSQADIALTKKLKEALQTIHVQVVDHFIVAAEDCMSFAERGLL